MYDRDFTETSKGALVELLLSLGIYRQHIVLVGGWAPYFLTRNHFDHCGSIDIDLVLHPSIIVKYESIRSIVNNLGYRQTPNIFRFKRTLISPKTNREYSLHLDFLTEPHATREGVGKRAYYSLTARGDAAIKRCKKSGSIHVYENHNL